MSWPWGKHKGSDLRYGSPWGQSPLGAPCHWDPSLPPSCSHTLPLPSASDFVLFGGFLTIWGAGGGGCTLRKGAWETGGGSLLLFP